MKMLGKFSNWLLEVVNNETSNIIEELKNRLRVPGMDEAEFLNKRLEDLKPEKKSVGRIETNSSIKDMIKTLAAYNSLKDEKKTEIENLTGNSTIQELVDIFTR